MAIQSFSNGNLEDLFHSGRSSRIQPPAVKRKLVQLMDLLDYAIGLGDLHGQHHFHALKGNRRGTYAFHVTRNWRLTFKFKDGDAHDLDYEDYHRPTPRYRKEEPAMRPRNRRPTNPGELLKELFLEPRGITIGKFAEATGLTRKHISNIVNGHSALSPETAVKFGTVLDTSAELWMNAQRGVDIWDARRKLKKWKPGAVYSGEEVSA